MMEYINLQLLKKKFAVMISKLNTNAGIPLDNISDKIVADDFFDFMERQQAVEFMRMSHEKMARDLFGCDFVFDEDVNSELYWTGLQYMNICINRQMPLRQVMLLCPLDKMLSHFAIYHEINDTAMIREYCENEYKTSILRSLRKRAGYSVSALGALTSIPANTIKYYEKSNDNLFGASFENIRNLAYVLEVPQSVFARKSMFTAYSRSLLEDKRFVDILGSELEKIYSKKIRKIDSDGELTKIEFESSKRAIFVSEIHMKKAWGNAFEELVNLSEEQLLI